MATRIAVVQHGDVREARWLRASGLPEPYFGMHHSQGFLDDWMAGRPHLVVSLNAPVYRVRQGEGLLVGLPEPRRIRGVPATIRQALWSWQIIRELRRFRPTHFLLRTGSLVGAILMRMAVRSHWNSLAMFAGFFPNSRRYDRFITGQLVRSLNHPFVALACNHRQPATDSMIDAGLNPRKASAWDFPLVRDPVDFPYKNLAPGPISLVYAGAMTLPKGVAEVIDAAIALRASGMDLHLTLCGAGPDFSALQARAAPLGTAVKLLGRVDNDEVFRQMSAASFVCVPTRHDFPEGFPMTLTEALTAHTPILASDHPVFTRVLMEGQGLRYFPAGDAVALARILREVAGDPGAYAHLSVRTSIAFDRLQCPNRFGEIIQTWLPH